MCPRGVLSPQREMQGAGLYSYGAHQHNLLPPQLDRCLPTKPCPRTALQPEVWLELELTWGIFPSVCWRTRVWDSQREELAPRMFFYSSLGIP